MDQNKKNKVKDFFRKEGFYLVLFVCLCIVATVAAFTIRKNSVAKEENKVNNELSLNEVEDNTSSETDSNFNKQNAERVENNDELANSNEESLSEPEVASVDDEVATSDQEEVAENQTTEATEEKVADVSAGTDCASSSFAASVSMRYGSSAQTGKLTTICFSVTGSTAI